MPNPRGLLLWLQGLKAVQRTPLEILQNSTIAIDAAKYFTQNLAKDGWADALGVIQTAYIRQTVTAHVRAFEANSTTPIFFFAGTPAARRVGNDPSNYTPIDGSAGERDRAWTEYREGRQDTATLYLNDVERTFDLLTRPAIDLIRETLLELGVKVMIAPYNVEPQMAWFAHPPHQFVHAVYGDTDLFLFAVDKVITRLDMLSGDKCEWVSLASVLDSTELTFRQLTEACMMAGYRGCETLPPLLDKMGYFEFQRAVDMLLKQYQAFEALTPAQRKDPAFAPLTQIMDKQVKWESPAQKIKFARNVNANFRYLEDQVVYVGGRGEMGPLRSRHSTPLPVPKVAASATRGAQAKRLFAKAQAKGTILQDFDESNGHGDEAESKTSAGSSSSSSSALTSSLPSTITTMLASGALTPATLEPFYCGTIADRTVHVLSSAYPRLLDALAPLRAQTLLLLAAAFEGASEQTPQEGTASLAHVVSELSKSTSAVASSIQIPPASSESSLQVLNVRFYDRYDGYWPRELTLSNCSSEDEQSQARDPTPDVFDRLSELGLTTNSSTDAQSFVLRFLQAAKSLCAHTQAEPKNPMGVAFVLEVLTQLTTGANTAVKDAVESSKRSEIVVLTTVALAILFALDMVKFVKPHSDDSTIELTPKGQATAAAAASLAVDENKESKPINESVATALVLASVLCQTQVLTNSNITLILPLSTSATGSGFFKPYNHAQGENTVESKNQLYFSRLVGLLPFESSASSSKKPSDSIIHLASSAGTCEDVAAVADAGVALHSALRSYAEAFLSALLATQQVLIKEASDFHDDDVVEDEADPEYKASEDESKEEPGVDDNGISINIFKLAQKLPFTVQTRPCPLAGIQIRQSSSISGLATEDAEGLASRTKALAGAMDTLLKSYHTAGISVEVDTSVDLQTFVR